MFSSHSYADQLVDPTMPDSYKANNSVVMSSQTLEAEGSRYEWVLNSTLISPSHKLAIINGKQLNLGDEINGAIVKKIAHQQVMLSYQNEIVTLSLHQSFISQIKGHSASH